jgi:imidazolonepropionase-like amidohydrolase
VLGLEEQVGSLEPGKRADIILVDFDQPHLMLDHQPVSKLVYSARGHDVTTTIVDGQVVMEDRRVLTLDEAAVLDRARDATADLISRAGMETGDLLNAGWPEQGPRWRGAVRPEWFAASQSWQPLSDSLGEFSDDFMSSREQPEQ